MTSVTDSGSEEAGAVEAMALETWRASLNRNLDTAFLVTQAALPSMKEHRWGRIVSVSSVTGPVMAMRHEPPTRPPKPAWWD
jgi:3-oxoacyl-[acyl-carrier protein] reductase